MIMVLHDYFCNSLLSQALTVCVCKVSQNIQILVKEVKLLTKNQILFQELQQTKRRDAVNAEVARGNLAETIRHNTNVEMETHRHNLVTESQTDTNLKIQAYNSESQRISALAQRTQAGAAVMNANTNIRMADIAQQNADTNRYDAESRRMVAEEQKKLYSAEALIKQNEASNWLNTHTVQMENLEAQTSYYKSQGKSSERQADVSERNARVAELRLQMERILNEASLRLTNKKIENVDADTALKLVQAGYQNDKNVREWINTVFGSLESFTQSWKNASSKDGVDLLTFIEHLF